MSVYKSPDNCHRIPVTPVVTLFLLFLAAILLTTGCVSQTQDNQTHTVITLVNTTATTIVMSPQITPTSIPITSIPIPSATTCPASPPKAKNGNSKVLLEFPGNTTILDQGATSANNLRTVGIRDPYQQGFTDYLKSFDLVTLNNTNIHSQLTSGQEIPVIIRGKEFTINITGTFSGLLIGNLNCEKNSRVFFTTSLNQTQGSVILNNETFNIVRYSEVVSASKRESPAYYIYSSKDVYFNRRYVWLCGGGFDVSEVSENESQSGNVIHLTEADFGAVPQLRAIVQNCTLTTENKNSLGKDNKTACTGTGWYDCQGWHILGNYAYNSFGAISGNYLEYHGKFFALRSTYIS